MKLADIVVHECVPQRDCMLTVTDSTGETAFLYFKDAELIEANYAASWGKDALAQILSWTLAEYYVTGLPLGIRRSLWDKIEQLLDAKTVAGNVAVGAPAPAFSIPTASGTGGTSTGITGALPAGQEVLQRLPGLTKLVQVSGAQATTAFEAPNASYEPTDWLGEFFQRSRGLGETLGMGRLAYWTLTTDRYRMIATRDGNGMVAALCKNDGTAMDDVEAMLRSGKK